MKKPTPNMAVVIRIAFRSPLSADGSTGKKSLAIIGVMKAKTRKSYHSSALPMTAAARLRTETLVDCMKMSFTG
ncbi:hypothetical protein TKWG_01370 [Advenella kashmirensis WT001]|uniref:Uncharacterized protein n=1 Tax=Advenella kashmirensis (strain DSM 17095 / LMG 22695 / WT001) TaxID=1036672 RepID=I3U7F8_ADVKW|nr:hypothetical protein TKWG_01370 [Advenella kashmirensis WT001]